MPVALAEGDVELPAEVVLAEAEPVAAESDPKLLPWWPGRPRSGRNVSLAATDVIGTGAVAEAAAAAGAAGAEAPQRHPGLQVLLSPEGS